MKACAKLLIAICVTGVFGAAHAEGQPDSPDVIKVRVVGNTVCGESNGYYTCIYYNANGTISGKAGTSTAKGTYEVKEDGMLCTKWDNPQWQSGCAKQYPNDKGEIQSIDDGGKTTFLTKMIEMGNKL